MKKIAVVGTGIMGAGIASNFLKRGFSVTTWNRNKEKLNALVKLGAQIAATPKSAAEGADIVIEVTANDESSRLVWLGDEGIIKGAGKNTILIACSTLSANWVDELSRLCADKQLNFFDMPMTGGRIGAETGKLVLLVGGDENKLQDLTPDLQAISEKIIYFGKAGSGTRYKLLLNMLQAIHIEALGEILKIADQSGLDVKRVGDALAERPGGTTTNLAWRDYQTKPTPINFSVQWIMKDLGYAKALAANLSTPLLDETMHKYQEAIQRGLQDEDWTAINHI